MGKTITSVKRGKGSPTYTKPSHRFKGASQVLNRQEAQVIDIITSQAHSAPVLVLQYEDNSNSLMVAPEGLRVGDTIQIDGTELKNGNFMKLKDVAIGVDLFNIERVPGDGGKFVRSSGASAKVVAKTKKGITVKLPSKKLKTFHPDCRATIGVVAGGGRKEKPFFKAGRKFHAMKAKNVYWPITSATSMNAADHPFGNTRSLRKAKSRPAPANAPPGRKVGAIRPRKTGRGK